MKTTGLANGIVLDFPAVNHISTRVAKDMNWNAGDIQASNSIYQRAPDYSWLSYIIIPSNLIV